MKEKIYDMRKSSNVKVSNCCVCKKKYFKRKNRTTAKLCGIVRKNNSFTCSPTCSKIRLRNIDCYKDRSEYYKEYNLRNKAKIKEYHRLRWIMKKESLK